MSKKGRDFSLKFESTKDLFSSLHSCYSLHYIFFCRKQFPILSSCIIYVCFHIVFCPKQLLTADLLLLLIHSGLYRQVMKVRSCERAQIVNRLVWKVLASLPFGDIETTAGCGAQQSAPDGPATEQGAWTRQPPEHHPKPILSVI